MYYSFIRIKDQGRRNLMHKGVQLRTQYFAPSKENDGFAYPEFEPQ